MLIRKVLFRARAFVWRLLVAMSGTDAVRVYRLPGGLRFEYPLNSAIGRDLFAGGFETAEVDFVRRHLKAGDVVLDVGANAGLYTLLAAKAVGDRGHVYAFEPGERAVQLLRHNIAINKLGNVTVIEAAVSDTTGQASFAVTGDTALGSLADTGRDDQQISSWQTVRTIRLDDAVIEYAIPRVTFIKMDVEGAEKPALDGAPLLLEQTPAPLTVLFEAFETNARAFGYTVPELLDSLRARGFRLHGFDRDLTLRPAEHFDAGIGSTIYNFVAYRT